MGSYRLRMFMFASTATPGKLVWPAGQTESGMPEAAAPCIIFLRSARPGSSVGRATDF